MDKDVLHIIGDSHASFFSGKEIRQPTWPEPSNDIFPYFKTYKIGPSTAYNLCKRGTKTKGREKLFKIIYEEVPFNENIMLSFGEIDCRAHILKMIDNKKKSYNDVIKTVVERYLRVILEIKQIKDKKLSIWNVIPSSYLNKIKYKKWPVYKTVEERNKVSKMFNKLLELKCKKHDIIFIDVFDNFVNEKLITKKEFYRDEIHLSQKSMPIILKELKKYFVL